MLDRNTEAITAADAALAVEGNLTTVHSIAWYNKGNALRALGRIADAQDAYAHAYALDNTLVPPDMSRDTLRSTIQSSTATIPLQQVTNTPPSGISAIPVTTPRSPLPVFVGIAAVILAIILCARRRNSS